MNQPKVLLVDDEQNVLDSLALILRRQYTVLAANSGSKGLELLASDNTIAVVVSDMRMPGMSGAEFLAQARTSAPAAVRLLLTGQADLTSAIAAINDGQVFRFLTKPIAPQAMLSAIDAAIRQNRLLLAEQVLLEETLRGSIQTLTEVLALANPALFGRATRIKSIVNTLMQKLEIRDQWQIDVAAMMLPLAQVSLPPDTQERLGRSAELSADEQAMVARLPELTDNLLAHIPRLEVVRVILAHVQEPYRQSTCIESISDAPVVLRGTQLLRVAIAFDALMQSGLSDADALAVLRGQPARYDAGTVAVLGELHAQSGDSRRVVEVNIKGLVAGMMLAEDLATRNGILLLPRGCEVTATFVERLRNYKAGSLADTVRIVVGGRGASV